MKSLLVIALLGFATEKTTASIITIRDSLTIVSNSSSLNAKVPLENTTDTFYYNYERNLKEVTTNDTDCSDLAKVGSDKTVPVTNSSEAYDPRIPFSLRDSLFTSLYLVEVEKRQTGSTIVMSPLSVLYSIAQLALHANGPSFYKLIGTLNLTRKSEIRRVFPNLKRYLAAQQKVYVNLTHKVYANVQYELTDAFKQDSKEVFFAEAENIDFSKPSQAAKRINAWAASETNKTITHIISPQVLGPDTRLVILNAVRFKGYWETQFDPKNTKYRNFKTDSMITNRIKTMFTTGYFKYSESSNLDSKIIELPFLGDLSMVIVLPNQVDGLSKLLLKIKDQNLLNGVLSRTAPANVNVYLPVINTTTVMDLPDILKKINDTGLFDAVTPGLDGILTQRKDVYVTNGIQKANILIDETGAPAKPKNATRSRSGSHVYNFIADHPFIYFIKIKVDPRCPLLCGCFLGEQ